MKRTTSLISLTVLIPLIASTLVLLEAGSAQADQHAGLGATCWARPFTRHKTGGWNVCRTVPEQQYPGVHAFAAPKLIVKECRDLNALDEGCAHGSCCYPQCQKVAVCIGPTPNRIGTDQSGEETWNGQRNEE